MHHITVRGERIPVLRKRVKLLRLRLLPDGTAQVTAPLPLTDSQIAAFVERKWPWVIKKREEMAARPQPEALRLETGCQLPLWGETLALRVEITAGTWKRVSRQGNTMMLICGEADGFDQRRALLLRFYQQEAKIRLERLIPVCEAAVGRRAAGWTLRPMKSRWGSCTGSTGQIRISTLLTAYPEPCLQGVMIHELTHLWVPGHGPDFYQRMDRAWPEWREWDALLKKPEPVLRQLFTP